MARDLSGYTTQQLEDIVAGKSVGAPALRSPTTVRTAQPTDLTADRLNQVFGGVLAGKGQAVIDAAKAHGVDPRLAASIILTESGGGSSHVAQTKNNVMGIWDPKAGTSRTFGSVEDGLDYSMNLLRKGYLDQGLETPEAIGAKWAPPGAANDPNRGNAGWPAMVRAGISKLGGPGGNVQPGLGLNIPEMQGNVITMPDEKNIVLPYQLQRTDVNNPQRVQISPDQEATYGRFRAMQVAKTMQDSGIPVTRSQFQDLMIKQIENAQQLNQRPVLKQLEPDDAKAISSSVNSFNLMHDLQAAHANAIKAGALGYGKTVIGGNGPGGIPIPGVSAGIIPNTKEDATFKTLSGIAAPEIGRALYGRLTEGESHESGGMLVQPGDTPEQAQAKTMAGQNLILQQAQTKLQDLANAGYDTSKFDAQIAALQNQFNTANKNVATAPGDDFGQKSNANQVAVDKLNGLSSTKPQPSTVAPPAVPAQPPISVVGPITTPGVAPQQQTVTTPAQTAASPNAAYNQPGSSTIAQDQPSAGSDVHEARMQQAMDLQAKLPGQILQMPGQAMSWLGSLGFLPENWPKEDFNPNAPKQP